MAQDWFDQGVSQPPASSGMGGWYEDPYKRSNERRANEDQAIQRTQLGIAQAKDARDARNDEKQDTQRGYSRGDTLRGDFDGQKDVQNYRTVIPIFLSGLNAEPNATGDLQLMNAYSKVVDPSSVVREGEVQMAGNTDTILNQVIAKLRMQGEMDGGGNLSPTARARLKDEMNTRVAQLAKAYGVQRARFQEIAKRQNVNPEDVVGPFPVSPAQIDQYKQVMGGRLRDQPIAIPGANGGGSGGPDQIDPTGGNPLLSPEDRDYLSKNARYMDAQGIRNWFADRKLSVPDSEIDKTLAYYKGGGGQNATVNAPQGEGSTFGQIAAGPVGAYFSGVGNGFLPGLTDEIGAGITSLAGADYAATRDALNTRKQALADANPIASTLGNVTGGLAAIAAPGAALSRLGVGGATSAATFAPRLLTEDALYGAAYGAGENNSDRLTGGLTGALEGAGGGVLGRGATRAVGGAIRGLSGPTSDAVRYLREQGIPMTIPQMVGGRLKTREDRLMGFQGIGNRIAEERGKGFNGLNQAAFRQVYDTAGEVPPDLIGEEGIDALKQTGSKLYDDALAGKRFPLDPAFNQDMSGAWALGTKLPELADQFKYSVGKASENIDNGEITGKGLQAALQRLRKDSSSFAGQPRGADFADALGLVERALTEAAGRADPTVVPALEKANRFYREGKILENAVGAARNAGLGKFNAAQLNNAAYSSAKKFGGNQATTDRPFYELTRAAQEVLPSTIPDSGTAGRTATSLPRDAAREALNTPMYADIVRRLAEPLLLDRPPQMVRAGDIIVNRARLPGLFGSMGALQYGQ